MEHDPIGGPPRLWLLGGSTPSTKQLLVSDWPHASLSVNPPTVSQVSGGNFVFQLDAAPMWASAAYTLLVGSPNPGNYIDGLGTLPLTQSAGLTNGLRALYGNPELAGGFGHLGGLGTTTVTWTVPPASSLPAALLDRDLDVCFVAKTFNDNFISEAVHVTITQ